MIPRIDTLIKIAKVVVPLGALLTGVVVLVVVVGVLRAWWSTPFPVFGLGEAAAQPISFPHIVHVEQLGIQCEFCHRSVTKGEAATVPAVEQCMFCHKEIQVASGELVYAGKGIDGVEILHEYWTSREPINWARVHRLPDHVQFTHEPHIRFFTEQKGMDTQQVCTLCHGDVGSMAEVQQVEDLKMSDCVDCHRNNSAPTDCVACHY